MQAVPSTKVRLDKAPMLLAMMMMMSLRDFHDLASLNTLSSLNDLSMESPEMPSARSSTSERMTMKKSKMFQPSTKKNLGLMAAILAKDSIAKMAVKK